MDALPFLLLLSVVGHADLLQERNTGSDLQSVVHSYNTRGVKIKVKIEFQPRPHAQT